MSSEAILSSFHSVFPSLFTPPAPAEEALSDGAPVRDPSSSNAAPMEPMDLGEPEFDQYTQKIKRITKKASSNKQRERGQPSLCLVPVIIQFGTVERDGIKCDNLSLLYGCKSP